MWAVIISLALGQLPSASTSPERQWLASTLENDLKTAGKFDSADFERTRQQIAGLSEPQVQALVEQYRRLRAPGATPATLYRQAIADYDQAVTVRDGLRQQVAFRTQYPAVVLPPVAATIGTPLFGPAAAPANNYVPGYLAAPGLGVPSLYAGPGFLWPNSYPFGGGPLINYPPMPFAGQPPATPAWGNYGPVGVW